ncbi:DUF4209 domain-containing protein [Myroides odoratimimus]|uniref:DUF4209 domain-containing protein n=1 Tax=Myroides odoratimimus TaxID=76832 RepID=UPI002DBC2FCA|nr:DUF4209 domain-containing protein [Myroides odoratimimus]MEC4095397.1 DUF4209 domain-containing protein [Myroides odoratimimus]
MNLDELYNYLEDDKYFNLVLNNKKVSLLIGFIDSITDKDLKDIYVIEEIALLLKYDQDKGDFQLSWGLSWVEKLNDKQKIYLESRIKKVENPIYVFNYCYIYFLLNNKNRKFLNRGIDNYLIFVNKLSDEYINLNEDEKVYLYKHFLGLIYVSQNFKIKQEEVNNLLRTKLVKLSIRDFCRIANEIIKNKKIKVEVKRDIYDHLYSIYDKQFELIKDNELKFFFLEVLTNLYKKIFNKEDKRLLSVWGKLLMEEEGNNPFHKNILLEQALHISKRASNKQLQNNAFVKLQANKNDIKLPLHISKLELEGKIKEMYDYISNRIKEVVDSKDSEVVLRFLVQDDNFLIPKATKANINEIQTPFMRFITMKKFDINMNVVSDNAKGITIYKHMINSFSIPFIHEVFSESIKDNVLNYDSYINFLTKDKWLGNVEELIEKRIIQNNWIELLKPSLSLFFETYKDDIESGTNSINKYILVLDSLVLKFEGLFRDFLKLVEGHAMIINNTMEHKENVSFIDFFEKDIIKEKISDDNIYYFKFLFTKEGLDLRNNIAHAFYDFKHYNSYHIMLLLIAILRLGNYKMTISESEENS